MIAMLQFKGPSFPLKFGKRILGLQMEGEAVALFCPPPWESLDQIFKQSVKFTYPMNLVKGGTFSFKWSSSVCFQSFAIDSQGDLTKTYLTCTNNSSQLAGIQTRVNQKIVTFKCFVIEDVNNKTVVEMRVFFQTSCYSHTNFSLCWKRW